MKPYFSHDFDSRSSRKIKKMLSVHGMQGYGIYWALAEDLYNNANALQTDFELIAFDLRVDTEVVRSIIFDFDLFNIDGNTFSCDEVEERLNQMKVKSERAADSAKHRWNKGESERNANAMRTHSDGNANKNKIENKINTTTTTGEADFTDFDFQIQEYFKLHAPAGCDHVREAKNFINLNELKNWAAAGGIENWPKVADLYIHKIRQKNGSNKRIGFTEAASKW